MPKRQTSGRNAIAYRLINRLDRRICPTLVGVVFTALGCAYFFRWGPIVQHRPYFWLEPGDLGRTYLASSQLAHGHFSAIYTSGLFLAFPGILILLAPFGALSNMFRNTLVGISRNHHALARPEFGFFHPSQGVLNAGPLSIRGIQYIAQPQWFEFVAPYALLLSCTALFACDALAERLGVSRSRRIVLCVAEAVVLWNVSVSWGHPEDALAVALAVYSLLFAMEGRFAPAGWLFGAAVAVQPLVIVMFPILLLLAGRERSIGFLVRSAIPSVVILIPPLASGFHATVQTLGKQPAFPNAKADHRTPWTFLASSLGGNGTNAAVEGGPIRTAALALAIGLGLWARRWKDRPEMIVWAVALALALRSYTESVMTDYYAWPALAVGLVVASLCSPGLFGASVAVAIATTICAQWHLAWLPWWTIDVAGITALLLCAARPRQSVAHEEGELGVFGTWVTEMMVPSQPVAGKARTVSAGSNKKKQQQRKTARTNRKRAGRR